MADEKKDVSRRDFLKTAGVATGALVGGGVIGGLIGYNAKDGGNATKDGERSGGQGRPIGRFTGRPDVLHERP